MQQPSRHGGLNDTFHNANQIAMVKSPLENKLLSAKLTLNY